MPWVFPGRERERAARQLEGDAAISDSIHVCGLALVPTILKRSGARHLMTIINEQALLETPAEVLAGNHLRLAVNDIVAPQPGRTLPAEDHIAQLLNFVARWDRQAPLLIHCWAGISRSTAGAFISLCALNPATSEQRIAEMLRRASPTADPNKLMVEHADALLGRNGRMIAAVEAIADYELAPMGRPFWLPARIA